MQPIPQTDVHPDCWWGPDGIDALIWADGIPYEIPSQGEHDLDGIDGRACTTGLPGITIDY